MEEGEGACECRAGSIIGPVTIKSVEAKPRRFAWLSPFLVVLLGTVVVAFLLAAPIRIGPGDHEKYASCGNALDMDLGPWEPRPTLRDGEYHWDHLEEMRYYHVKAYRACTGHRIDRIAQAVGAISVTLLISAVFTLRGELRRRSLSKLGPDDL